MRYSVLMSVYKNDDPGYLQCALESIYEQQTRRPDEIVVVFDGPLTDDLYAVLEAFSKDKEEIVKYLPQETNKGLGEALRVGAAACTGDYLFRMDSDDVSVPSRFEKQIEYLETHPEVDVLGTDIAEFNISPDEENKRIRRCPQDHEDIVNMGKTRNPMNHVSVCIKKEALDDSGGYEELALLEDYYLWLKMIVAGKVLANINEPLVCVRIGNGFNSKRGNTKRIDGWRVLQKYMVDNKMITHFIAVRNMLYIYGFVYCPRSIRKFAYKFFLRR